MCVRTFLVLHEQIVVVLIKRFDGSIRSKEITFQTAFSAFDESGFKTKWSRHLEQFNDALFVDVTDPIQLNPFDPFKRVFNLTELSDNRVAYHIIMTYGNEDEFDKLVYYCLIKGLGETFLMMPNASVRVADALLALKMLDIKTEKKVKKEGRHASEKTSYDEAAQDAKIVR